MIAFEQQLFTQCNKTELAVASYIQQKLAYKNSYHFSAERIGKAIGKSKPTCARALIKLERLGYLSREKQKSGRVLLEWHTEPLGGARDTPVCSRAPEVTKAPLGAPDTANSAPFSRKQFEATMAHYYGHIGKARSAFKHYKGGSAWEDLERFIQRSFDSSFVPLSDSQLPEERPDLHPANRPRPWDIIINRFAKNRSNSVKRVRTWCRRNGINSVELALTTNKQPPFFTQISKNVPF